MEKKLFGKVNTNEIYWMRYKDENGKESTRQCKVVGYTMSVEAMEYGDESTKRVLTLRISGIKEPVSFTRGKSSLGGNIPVLYYSKDGAQVGHITSNKDIVDMYVSHDSVWIDMLNRLDLSVREVHKYGCGYRKHIACWCWDGYNAQLKALTGIVATVDLITGAINLVAPPTDMYYHKEECEDANEMVVYTFDDEQFEDDEDFAEQKREEFREYVSKFAGPEWADMIEWEYFENLKSMQENMSIQIEVWRESNN